MPREPMRCCPGMTKARRARRNRGPWLGLLLLIPMLGFSDIGFSDDHVTQLTDELVHRLLYEAGEVPIGGLEQTLRDAEADHGVATLPALVLRAWRLAERARIEDDFRLSATSIGATSSALFPMYGSRQRRSVRPYYARASLLHMGTVQRTTVRHAGTEAEGSAQFKTTAYDGMLTWRASFANGRWRIHEIRLPISGITFRRIATHRWQHVGASERAPSVLDDEALDEEIVEEEGMPAQEPDTANERPPEGGEAGGSDQPFEGPGTHAVIPSVQRVPPPRTPSKEIRAALDWLAAHQSTDGGWRVRDWHRYCKGEPNAHAAPKDVAGTASFDVGVTGLAIMAFLGSGYTNRGKHPYQGVVNRGLRYLRQVQDPEGCFGPRTGSQYTYNHAMAAIAMVEAFGMTESPIFKVSAQKALDFHAMSRNPYAAWRYGVRPGENDSSVSAWMSLALLAAERINEDAKRRGSPPRLTVDKQWKTGVSTWFDKMTAATGRVGYMQVGSAPARRADDQDRFPADSVESLTAAANLVRQLGQIEGAATQAAMRQGIALVLAAPPDRGEKNASVDLPYWFFGSALLVAAERTTPRTVAWVRAARKAVLAGQVTAGGVCGLQGSFQPNGAWGSVGGRVYSTALSVFTLQAAERVRGADGKR